MGNTFESILKELRATATSTRDLGDKFERLVATVLRTDSSLTTVKYKNVWLWSDWPFKDGQPDTGIDLVAEEAISGEYVAFQCKFYDPEHCLSKEDIDSFFTASGKSFKTKEGDKRFSKRFIVSTTDLWSKHAVKALENQNPPSLKIGIQDFLQSSIDWDQFDKNHLEKAKTKQKKSLKPHQKEALKNVELGFKSNSRGKMIMACGTGKTFTSLKIVEHLVPNGGQVLFLVPSIALLSQTLKEWMVESEKPLNCFAVCSDSRVGKNEDMSISDLSFPATTDTDPLLEKIKLTKSQNNLTVVFSTYQSIQVVSDAQSKGLSEFDLVICDEAHRTTGAIAEGDDKSAFVKVHDENVILAKKRLYMTATPRIYSEAARTKAQEDSIEVFSMDDETKFGPEFHRLSFSQAVTRDLLTDYKVLVLGVDERYISHAFQSMMTDENSELELDDVVKIVGCWNGLAKKIDSISDLEKLNPMRRAVAFSSTIKMSKHIQNLFTSVVDTHIQKTNDLSALRCEIDHIDGSMNVLERNKKLGWLKDEPSENTCRILTNAKCLSEGVDVPSLDAVMFLTPRNSVVDVVQSVGRVMRLSPGKKYGYIILPVGIPSGMEPDDALDDNEKYKVVWQVLNALRAHDDRFDAVINKIKLNNGVDPDSPIITSIIGGGNPEADDTEVIEGGGQSEFVLEFPHLDEWKNAIYAKLVQKCGTRLYWDQWAKDVAEIASKHVHHIKRSLTNRNDKTLVEFEKFLDGLRKNLNPSISEDEAIEMLAQHLITKPIFDALFENYEFTNKNPVSRAMEGILEIFRTDQFNEDKAKLELFYDSVRQRVRSIFSPEGRQKVIVDLYDKFFKVAFPKMTERLGIVYTPVEVVDFIIHSVESVLNKEFGKSLSDKDVHALDPFTGTGTFIVRLLQSGIINKEDLKYKYTNELHANEIVLLAYYIATINIEETFHGVSNEDYTPFKGVLLTDTFQLAENDNQRSFELAIPDNEERINRQKDAPIQVIIGNPPYSAGQRDANDNNQNLDYPKLDSRIEKTYAKESTATLKNSLYDSYIRSLRWATDRIGESGIIGFVTNGAFIDSNSADGLRKSLCNEFSKIYCFNLRGNQRTSGELSRKEGGKIFGSGSRTQVAITILIKDPRQKTDCEILYHDIGNYLSREEKLQKIKNFESIDKVPWQKIIPNEHGDWIKQRNESFMAFLPMGSKRVREDFCIFEEYSSGVSTNRDAWAYSFNKKSLEENIKTLIRNYNEEVIKIKKNTAQIDLDNVDDFINLNSSHISWTRGLKQNLLRKKEFTFNEENIVKSFYRPFNKMWLYFGRDLNEGISKMPKIFPGPNSNNMTIMIKARLSYGNIALITDQISSIQPDGGQHCFPLFLYSGIDSDNQEAELIDDEKNISLKQNAITDSTLQQFATKLKDDKITKEDIFFYVYGLLHSESYLDEFRNNFLKMLPRIPVCKSFWSFSEAGRNLANLHINYETITPYELNEVVNEKPISKSEMYKINEKGMRWAKEKKIVDKSKIHFNRYLTLSGIPLEAYDYVVNGKSAIEWIMERYSISVDLNSKGEGSGIKNDPNEWSDDSRYIVDLVKRIVRVSTETNKIVNNLPALDIISDK